MRFIYKFTSVKSYMTDTNMVSYIIGVIISVIIMYGLLIIYTTIHSPLLNRNEEKYMFVSPPNNNLESFTCETNSNIGGCVSSEYGCCPDGVTAKTRQDDPCVNYTTISNDESSNISSNNLPDSWNFSSEENGCISGTSETSETGETSETSGTSGTGETGGTSETSGNKHE